MTPFEGIVPALGAALEKRGYTALTPVQTAVIDPALAAADLLVSAQTGSGKTVAFGMAVAETLLAGAERFGFAVAPLCLAVAPTRELALQVKRELEWLYEATGANIASCVGGMDMRAERRSLERGAHIVVGTPGRLRDHIERGSLDMTALRAVVLDEADEMLDLGFREDLEFILDSAPADRRTLMFSATVPKAIATLAKSYQRDAVRLSTAAEQKQHVDIEYRALTCGATDRDNAIINVLRFYEAKNALVFCSTRAAVNHMTARFNNRGFSVVALSGELSQNERTHALQAMRDGRAKVCIATDVAARGIDLPGLDLVVHADLPTNRDTLLHRSGRTGRAGNKGVSALIVTPADRKKAERLLAAANINAAWARPPSADDVTERDNVRLLSSGVLSEPMAEDDAPLVAQILKAFTAEQIAAAFVRLSREGRSAPEELHDSAREPEKRPREEFGASVWISLSVGRHQNAEPRWLLPMLCGAGNITKAEIGAIRLQDDVTHVQLSAAAADGFFAAVGPDMTLEKGIVISIMDSPPEAARGTPVPVRAVYRKSYDDDAPRSAPPRPRSALEGSGPVPQARHRASAPSDPETPERRLADPTSSDRGASASEGTPPGRAFDAAAKTPYARKPDRDGEAPPARAPVRPRDTAPQSTDVPRRAAYDPDAAPVRPKKPRAAGAAEVAPRRSGPPSFPKTTKPRPPAFDPTDPAASRRKPGAKPVFGRARTAETDTSRGPFKKPGSGGGPGGTKPTGGAPRPKGPRAKG